jgi:hypothetical protein
MTEKKRTYDATVMALPPLKMVLGDLPEPDPGQEKRPFHPFNGVSDGEARSTVERLIGHIKDKK